MWLLTNVVAHKGSLWNAQSRFDCSNLHCFNIVIIWTAVIVQALCAHNCFFPPWTRRNRFIDVIHSKSAWIVISDSDKAKKDQVRLDEVFHIPRATFPWITPDLPIPIPIPNRWKMEIRLQCVCVFRFIVSICLFLCIYYLLALWIRKKMVFRQRKDAFYSIYRIDSDRNVKV